DAHHHRPRALRVGRDAVGRRARLGRRRTGRTTSRAPPRRDGTGEFDAAETAMKRRAAAHATQAPIDLDRVRTYPLARRVSQVAPAALAKPPRATMSIGRFLQTLPDILGARDLRAVADAIAARHRTGRLVVLGMGAHPIKVGLSPLIIDLMQRRIIS